MPIIKLDATPRTARDLFQREKKDHRDYTEEMRADLMKTAA